MPLDVAIPHDLDAHVLSDIVVRERAWPLQREVGHPRTVILFIPTSNGLRNIGAKRWADGVSPVDQDRRTVRSGHARAATEAVRLTS